MNTQIACLCANFGMKMRRLRAQSAGAEKVLHAGADRIGASASIAIVGGGDTGAGGY